MRFSAFSAFLFMLLAMVWGSTFFLVEIALRDVSPLTLTFLRVALAAPVVWLLVRLRGLDIPRNARIWGAFMVMGALNNALPFSLIFWGQTRIESGLAAILNSMTAIFGALAAGIFLADEPLTRNKLIGAALGIAGVVVIIGPQALADLNPTQLGQLAVLGATLSYAFASVWGRRALRGQPGLVNAFGMLTCSSLLMVPVVLLIEGVPRFGYAPTSWAAILTLSVIGTAIAYAMYFAILVRAGAANLMLVTLLLPVVAVILGSLVLDERLSASAFAGFALIATGFAVTDGRLPARLRGGRPNRSRL